MNYKAWIDNSSYEELLKKWRFAPIGDPMFQGELGDYYKKVMAEKAKLVDTATCSKRVGWEK